MSDTISCKSSRDSSSETEPQPGDILLFCRARKFNRLITWFTKSPYYHAALYKGDGFVVEARPRGVIERDLNGPDGDKAFDVIEAPDGREKGEAALQWALSQVGKSYDKKGVAVLVADRMLRSVKLKDKDRDKFSCGELVTCAFLNAGVELFPDRNPGDIVPADFARFLPDQTCEKREGEE